MANIIEIHDFSDPALDVYARLTENQLLNRADPDNALFVAESLSCFSVHRFGNTCHFARAFFRFKTRRKGA